jgi:glycosyltransferase involved in cell wall biosynthesis
MRILYCNKYNYPFSGTEVYLLELMQMMRDRGHETALFSMANPNREAGSYMECMAPQVDFKSDELGFVDRARLAGHAIYSPAARKKLREMIRAFRPDVAHVRNIYHHLSPSIFWELRAQGVPVIYHLNDFKILCPAYNFVADGQPCEACRNGKFRKMIRKGCYGGRRGSALVLAAEAYFHRWLRTYKKCVDRFVAPSEFVKEKLIEYGFEEEKIVVIPHFQRVSKQMEAGAVTSESILYFGRLSKEKGVADLIQAMSQVPDLTLTVAGNGPQRQELENLSRELGLQNVRFMGQLSSKALEHEISISRFTVFPSLAYETLGKSILESYACERAVVASDRGSRREFVKDGVTGLLYEAGNPKALAEAIGSLRDHPEKAESMGRDGRRFVELRHSAEEHYEKMTALYEDLTASSVSRTKPNHHPTRIAFIGGRGVVSKYSGIESYYEQVGPRLVDLGYELTVYCRNHFTPDLAIFQGMNLVRLPTVRSKHLETLVHTFLSTVHAMCSDVDVVHYHALGPALFSFLPRLLGKKTVVTVQGLDWQRKKWGRVASWVLRLGELASAKLPNRTVVVSRVLQARYKALYGAGPDYVPNGTQICRSRDPQLVSHWGLEPDNYILFLGRFSPEKNCHLLIEAYESISTRMKLVLAGGSSHTDTYAAELRRHASEKVIFLDWVSGDALKELLSNAAIFVLPSDLEGLSLALLDAMGAGVCTLTSDIAENRELVDDAGFTFQRGNVRDLARMLEILANHPEVRKASGIKGQERIRQQYLWPDIAQKMGDIYDELTGRVNRRRPSASEKLKHKTAAA